MLCKSESQEEIDGTLKLGNWEFNKGTIWEGVGLSKIQEDLEGQDSGKATLILELAAVEPTPLGQKGQVDGTWKRIAIVLGKGYWQET